MKNLSGKYICYDYVSIFNNKVKMFSVFRGYKKGAPGSNGLRPYQTSRMELFAKIANAFSRYCFLQKVPSHMFDKVLNMYLDMLKNDSI